MKFILALFGFFFLIVTGFMAVIVWKVRKRMRVIREAMEDSMQDETFKRKQQQQTRRTTHTANGVTIIDDRNPDVANKKIFEKNEDEYVDYVES